MHATTTKTTSAPVPVRLCALTAMTPLHVGADGGFGLIDKPVMRERATGYPLLPGSALKGVVSADFRPEEPPADGSAKRRTPFDYAFGRGATAGEAGDSAGSLIFTDAQLMALPVRSFHGTTAWITTPYLMRRTAAQLKRYAGIVLPAPPNLSTGKILLGSGTSRLVAPVAANGGKADIGHVVLEDFDLAVDKPQADVAIWADWLAQRFWPESPDPASSRTPFLERFAVVSETVFDHLCRYGLEVRARVKIDQASRTVDGGKLWYEELLPEGSLLLAYVFCERVFRNGREEPPEPAQLLAAFCSDERYLQFGGTASVGRGLCRVAFHEPAGAQP
ncbi:MAG TPA: type III-B CRISPR module RAMP protein Cmr4 [Tahibacter sp.]|nr:type III-B CRISPR module RAMP protein Cmr4 [Tahibacter sp.]